MNRHLRNGELGVTDVNTCCGVVNEPITDAIHECDCAPCLMALNGYILERLAVVSAQRMATGTVERLAREFRDKW